MKVEPPAQNLGLMLRECKGKRERRRFRFSFLSFFPSLLNGYLVVLTGQSKKPKESLRIATMLQSYECAIPLGLDIFFLFRFFRIFILVNGKRF